MRWFRRGPQPTTTRVRSGPDPTARAEPGPLPAAWSVVVARRCPATVWTGEPILTYIQAGLHPMRRPCDDHLQLLTEPPGHLPDGRRARWRAVVTTHASSKDGAPETVIAAILALADHADAATLAATAEVLRTTEILPVVDAVLRGLGSRPIPDRRLLLDPSADRPAVSPTRPPSATSSSSGSR